MALADPFLTHLGVAATDENGNAYRVIVGEQRVGPHSVAYDLASAVAIPSGAVLTLTGWPGTWRYTPDQADYRDGYHRGSIS